MASLVTGATGFIGRHLVARLLERNGQIYIVVRAASPTNASRSWWAISSSRWPA
jgi:uncharacterized protein YbjT (DUF2867 family)